MNSKTCQFCGGKNGRHIVGKGLRHIEIENDFIIDMIKSMSDQQKYMYNQVLENIARYDRVMLYMPRNMGQKSFNKVFHEAIHKKKDGERKPIVPYGRGVMHD